MNKQVFLENESASNNNDVISPIDGLNTDNSLESNNIFHYADFPNNPIPRNKRIIKKQSAKTVYCGTSKSVL